MTRTNLPRIQVTGRHLRDISGDAIAALQATNAANPRIFTRGDVLVRVRTVGSQLTVEPLAIHALRGELERCADFVRQTNSGAAPAMPPYDMVVDIASHPDLPFPPLRGIAFGPVLVPGGRLLTRDGYDGESGILVKHDLPNLPSLPLPDARELLEDLLADFPFADSGSRAHAWALLFEPFVRLAIGGLSPLYMIDKPKQGTGAGLLVDVVAETAFGKSAEVMAQPRDNEEARKRITALLMEGSPLILIDNIRRLEGEALAAALTSPVWRDRLLGVSKMVSLPNKATWVATGNNVAMSGEYPRRVVLIRMDAGVDRPEERQGFRHPDLVAHVRQARHQLVAAVVAIVQEWVARGMPDGGATLGRFEEWAKSLSGLLRVAGIDGFLANRDVVYQYSEHERDEWQALVQAWWKQYESQPITAAQLLAIATTENLLLDIRAGRGDLAAQQRLGHALRDRRDQVFGQLVIRVSGRSSGTGSTAWRLEEVNTNP